MPGSISSTVPCLATLSTHFLVEATQIHFVPEGNSPTLLHVILLTASWKSGASCYRWAFLIRSQLGADVLLPLCSSSWGLIILTMRVNRVAGNEFNSKSDFCTTGYIVQMLRPTKGTFSWYKSSSQRKWNQSHVHEQSCIWIIRLQRLMLSIPCPLSALKRKSAFSSS